MRLLAGPPPERLPSGDLLTSPSTRPGWGAHRPVAPRRPPSQRGQARRDRVAERAPKVPLRPLVTVPIPPLQAGPVQDFLMGLALGMGLFLGSQVVRPW